MELYCAEDVLGLTRMEQEEGLMIKGMIIYCRGVWYDGHPHECEFIHNGKWGDKELATHEEHELSKEDGKSIFWLGFKRDDTYKNVENASDSHKDIKVDKHE